MQGYHETRGHSAASVHHTESILPSLNPNVKGKSRKKRNDSPLTIKVYRDKIALFINMRMWWNWRAMGAPPVAEASDLSEWPRSTDAKEHRRRRQMSGTATGERGDRRSDGRREPSEWPRSTDAKEHRRRRQMSGTATGRQAKKFHICGCGGIGRLIGFRFQRESVQVRVLSSAPNKKGKAFAFPFLYFHFSIRLRSCEANFALSLLERPLQVLTKARSASAVATSSA